MAKSIIALSTAFAAIAAWMIACSGGSEAPTVSGPGPGPDEPPFPVNTGGDHDPPVVTTTTHFTTTTTNTPTTTTTTSSACVTCSESLVSGEPQSPDTFCSSSLAIGQAFASCVCGTCSPDCDSWCDGTAGAAGLCASCAQTSCYSQLTACAGDV